MVIVHYISIMIGHLNHANISLDYRSLKYMLNNLCMHIWLYAKNLPAERRHGVNFGVTFSFWDCVFGTANIPENGRDLELGFDHVEEFPQTFLSQFFYPFTRENI